MRDLELVRSQEISPNTYYEHSMGVKVSPHLQTGLVSARNQPIGPRPS